MQGETQSVTNNSPDRDTENINTSIFTTNTPVSILHQTQFIRQRPHRNILDQSALTNEVLLSVKDHFKRPQIKDDRFDLFGKNVATKLCDLSNSQRVLAEIFINDILFEVEMNNLTISHKLVLQNQ